MKKKEEIRLLVDEGFEIDRKIKGHEKRMEEIKELLKGEAGGKEVTFVGTGCQAVIGQAAPIVKQVSNPEKVERLRKFCGAHFETLFKLGPVQKFREVAAAVFGKESPKVARLLSMLSGLPYATCKFEEIEVTA